MSLGNRGYTAYRQGDYDIARDCNQQSLALFRDIGHRYGIINSLINLGFVELAEDDLSASGAYFAEALIAGYEINSVPLIIETIVGFARLSVKENQIHRAAELAGLALHHPATSAELIEADLTTLHDELAAALPAAELDAALELGRALDLDSVIQQLLEERGAASGGV